MAGNFWAASKSKGNMMRLATIGTTLVVMSCWLVGLADAQMTVEQQLRARRGAAATMPAQPATRPMPARDHFIEIERISRLTEPERSRSVPAAYRGFAAQYLGMFGLSASSTLPPASLFERDQRVAGQQINTADRVATYDGQLEGMVGALSPEAVADAILAVHNISVLSMASHARLKHLFDEHRPDVRPLIRADLESQDPADVRRAVGVVDTLDLADFDEIILQKYLASAPGWEHLRVYLMNSRKDMVRERLMKDAQEHPESLTRHAAILAQTLRDQPTPEFLIKMLSSDSATARLGAAQCLESSGDPALAEPIIKLLEDSDQRIRIQAMYMTKALQKDAFTKVRPALRKLLESESQELKLQSAIALAAHQDPLAGPALLAYLKQPVWDATPLLTNRSIEATTALTGTRLGFISAPGRRDTPQNSQAIQKLEQWVNSHPVTQE